MQTRSIDIEIVKETANTVTIRFISLNRKMPVAREDFEKRVANNLYNIVEPTLKS